VTATDLIRLLARFTISPVPGGVELTCGRCEAMKVFTPRFPGEPEVALTDPVIWGRDHKCPQRDAPVLRTARELVCA